MAPKIPVTDDLDQTRGYVYKLWYGEMYLIVKCKTLARSIQNLNSDIDRFLKDTKAGRTPENRYFRFYIHIWTHPELDFRIEPILISDNPYQLLKQEVLSLEECEIDPNRCNKDSIPYIPPTTNQMNKSSWINRGYYLNFRKWYAKHTTQRQAIATNGC
jgi:hypothetical protein